MARYWSDGYNDTTTVGQAAPYEVTVADVARWDAKQDPLFYDKRATVGSENLLTSGVIALEFQEMRQYVQEEGGKAIYIEILVDSVTREYGYKSDNFEKVAAAFEKGKTVILHVSDANEYAYLQSATKDYFKFILFGKNGINAFQIFYLHSNGLITNYFINIPVLYEWALQEHKPTYTYSDVGADKDGAARDTVNAHNVSTQAHSDLRVWIQQLQDRINTVANSDDVSLDQLAELVAYIKDNRELIAQVTTDKVSVTDIIDNLDTADSSRPLSANQGAVLDARISQEVQTLRELINAIISGGGGDTSGVGAIQADWDATDAIDGAIKNKPPITKGTGSNSIVITTGEAKGSYSVAGGTNDSSVLSNFGYISSIEKPIAYGDISLSFGIGTKALTLGTIALGANSIAGCKGYYWWDIDFTTEDENGVITPTIRLSTKQKTLLNLSRDIPTNLTWEVGDVISIVNGSKYTLCSTIKTVDKTNGIITVDSLPFTTMESTSTPMFDDYSITCPSKPTSGEVDLGFGALATGLQNKAVGSFSNVEGWNNISAGDFSHSEGVDNIAGYSAHSEGGGTKALGKYSHTEGRYSEASGEYSHAQGVRTKAMGYATHTEGYETVAIGTYSHAGGNNSQAYGTRSFAHGQGVLAMGDYSVAIGRSDYAATAEDLIELSLNEVEALHSNEPFTAAIGQGSCSEGSNTLAYGKYAHAEGEVSRAFGYCSHTEGNRTTAKGACAHAEGAYSSANGDYAHAEGYETRARGKYSRTEGYYTEANGDYSHAECCRTYANGNYSHTAGFMTQTTTLAPFAYVVGQQNIANSTTQFVVGKYNKPEADGSNVYAFIVGNGTGTDTSKRQNIATINWSGKGYFKGGTTTTGADYAEYFEWADGNVDNEDRIGLIVTLDGEHIKPASTGDEVLGIISGTTAIIGDNYECDWNGKYLTDNFGRVIYEDVEEFIEEEKIILEEVKNSETGEIELVSKTITETKSLGFFKHPILNPDYDPTQEYNNRESRPEWDAVGMLGKLYVRDDGTCEVNRYATVGENGIATVSPEKTNMRVLSRVAENVIKVLLK